MTMDVIYPTTEEKTVPKTKSTSTSTTAKGKKKMSLGLDLGTLFSCYVNKLPKPDSDDSGATIIPSVVGYAEEGILSGILPGNNSTLFGPLGEGEVLQEFQYIFILLCFGVNTH